MESRNLCSEDAPHVAVMAEPWQKLQRAASNRATLLRRNACHVSCRRLLLLLVLELREMDGFEQQAPLQSYGSRPQAQGAYT